MKKKESKLWTRFVITLFLFLCIGITLHAQNQSKTGIKGTVYELDTKGKPIPLGFATVFFPDYGMGATTNDDGKFSMDNVPTGKARLLIQFIGKLSIDTLINVKKSMQLSFTLKNEDFKLEEVVVTAKTNQTGKSTASSISRQAMDHLQATSLNDLLSLMPGGTVSEPNLNSAQQINIRQISGNNTNEESLNALGTAIIRDGAPVSNNSNLSAMNATVSGGAAAMGGGASPTGGVDVRSISTENIESVEIIRGIPSVEYGDLTSGAVIVNTKAGREPLRVKAKANPNVYQVSMGTGYELGKNKGALNISADYAYNTNDPKATYQHYQRANGKLMYSNTFFDNKLRSNTTFDFNYGKDTRDRNPDDESTQTTSEGRDIGFRLNTNGTWSINKGWLQNIRYVLSGSYTDKQSFYETVQGGASATPSYSMSMVDGAILSNMAGKHLYDADGNEITHFGNEDMNHYAVFLPSSYLGAYEIDSREVNAFAKLTATLFKQSGQINNRILLGTDFKTDGNVGDGKTFDPTAPPSKGAANKYSNFRPRRYKDIPFINQFGIFAEDNFTWSIGERNLRVQAGVRFDYTSKVGSVWSPRFNASFDLIPNTLTLNGGYGITAKMPTLLYLYPENAYFEHPNINEMANENIPENERIYMTTTKIYETDNRDLKVARNHKAEIGFQLKLGKVNASVTAFQERLKNGYSLNYTFDTFKPFTIHEYTRNEEGKFILSNSIPTLNRFYTPTNNMNLKTQGVEFDINVGRIDAIRTSFQLNGAWMRTQSWNNSYDFYDNTGTGEQKPIAIYEPGAVKNYRQQFTTTLRATHNLPQIGFVVTLTAQAIWNQSNWKTFGNDTIPMGYISLDKEVTIFPEGKYTTTEQLKADGYDYLIQIPNHSDAIKESYKPYFCFNINVTKEISDMLRVSFFANNMFRSYPRMESKRNPGTYKSLNNRFFFGLELSMTL